MLADWRRIEIRAEANAQHLETFDRAFDKFTDIHTERIKQLAATVQLLAAGADARCGSMEACMLAIEGTQRSDRAPPTGRSSPRGSVHALNQ